MSASKPPCHSRGTVGSLQPMAAAHQPAPALYSAQAILAGEVFPELSDVESEIFSHTAQWLEQSISRPNPELGRLGDVCPWTRRTLQLGRLFVASIASCEPAHVDASLLQLLDTFQSLGGLDGAQDTFRAIVALFPRLEPGAGAAFTVAVHARLKPTFLKHRMMLGEFYPGCPKPGLRNPNFRPLTAPYPLLVMRAMVEPDLWFLTDQDAFVDAYLNAFGERGVDNLRQLLRESAATMDPERVRCLRRRVSLV